MSTFKFEIKGEAAGVLHESEAEYQAAQLENTEEDKDA